MGATSDVGTARAQCVQVLWVQREYSVYKCCGYSESTVCTSAVGTARVKCVQVLLVQREYREYSGNNFRTSAVEHSG